MRHLIVPTLMVLVAASAAAQDTVVIRSNGPGVWRDPRLIEELRIGVLDGDDRYVFGAVGSVVETADGSVWIVDSQGPRVRIYDRSGRHLRDVFRPGAGPGEIRNVMGIDLTPDGDVAIWDLPNQRISLYRQNGDYLAAIAAKSSFMSGESFRVDTAGRYWVYSSVQNPACIQRVTGADGRAQELLSEGPGCNRPAYVRLSRAGDVVDTVFVPLPQPRARVPGFVIMLPEGNVRPFVAEWDYSVSPRGDFVTAHTSRYAFTIVPAANAERERRVTRVEREHDPVRLTAGEHREWQARADYYTRRTPRGVSAGVEIPETKPPIRSVAVDGDGRIWVDRYVAAEKRTDVTATASPDRPPPLTWREPRTFDVFDPSGRFLGTVVAPRQTRFLSQRGSTIWAVVRGEMDESYVVRYRLVTN